MPRKKSSGKDYKKRNWAFVVYPESAPEDWREQLQRTGLACVISPLHDRDVNPTGEIKKPHYHVIVSYNGPTAYGVVKRITDGLGQPIPQPVEQIRGYYRYLTHADNPEKAQYDKADIETLNGFAIQDYVELTKSEVGKLKREIQQFILDNGIVEYGVLMDCLLHGGDAMADMYDVASSNTLFFTAYLKTKWRVQTGQYASDLTRKIRNDN